MSSSTSGLSVGSRHREVRNRGFPKSCICGEAAIIRTSGTAKNPGRLFHCCPYGSPENKYHLFKWTDELMVEEIEDIKDMMEKLQDDFGRLEKGLKNCESEVGNLEDERRTCEAVVNDYKKEIEYMRGKVQVCEEEIYGINSTVSSCVDELRRLRNLMVCGFLIVGIIVVVLSLVF